MGKNLESNCILKLNDEQISGTWKENDLWKFAIKRIRDYPLGTNIFLVDEKLSPKAYIELLDLKKDNLHGYTSGRFIIKRMFNEYEETFLRKIFLEMYGNDSNL